MKNKQAAGKAAVPKVSDDARRQMCSAWALDATPFAWDNRWGIPLEAAAAGAFSGDDVLQPPNASIFQQARRWHRLHGFIRNVLALKATFHNHGLLGAVLAPTDPKKPDGEQEVKEWHPGIRAQSAKDADKVRKWKEKNRVEIARVTTDCWQSYLLVRNAVALWRKNGRVIVLRPETCDYSDQFGVEKLVFRHGLTGQQIDEMPGLSKPERDQLKGNTKLTLTHTSNVFFFRVLKEEQVGMGFGWPDLATVFHACSLNESLLVGDRQLADACRSVYEQHLLGHEIKSGQHAGSPVHFMKKIRGESVKKEIQSKKGHIQLATNFDHDIKIGAGRPLPNQFDTKRYEQAAEQLATWGMPYGQMLDGVINPYLMTLAKGLAHADRERMQPFLAELLQEALGAPAPLVLQWDDTCFWDSRLLLDLLKTGLTAGPVSGESFLRKTGFNPADERAAKARDAQLPEDLVAPAFDAAHGNQPGKSPGKPPGKNDRS